MTPDAPGAKPPLVPVPEPDVAAARISRVLRGVSDAARTDLHTSCPSR
jgi:hypothetical protein